MALTPAEKQKRYRDKKKKEERAAPDIATNYLRRPFFESVGNRLHDLDFYWDIIGIEGPRFNDDSPPQSFTGWIERMDMENEGEPYPNLPKNSLGRAESMFWALMDIQVELASAMHDYKLEEIDARIKEIEAADLSDPQVKADALRDIAILKSIRERLDGKEFRRRFAEFSVKGTNSV
jgi:hypothetical protein